MQQKEKTNSRSAQFLRNIGIYAVGSIGTRFITFLLVPIYSFFIAPADFGYYDLCFNTVLFLLPLLSCGLREGSLRFLIDAKTEEEMGKIVTMTVTTLLINSLICLILGIVAGMLFDIKYLWYTVVFSIVFAIYDVVAQMLRALGHSKLFAATGVICSFLVFVISVPLVVYADMGVEGVFIGNIVARFSVLVIVELKVKLFSGYISMHTDLSEIRKKMMKFGLPLVAVNLIIWIIGSGNRFFIREYLGLHENGQYAVAVKFAAILEALTLIFNQSWQETAIRQYSDADKNEFYTKILNSYVWFLSLLVIGISYGARFVYGYIVGAEYQESAKLVYPLVASSMLLSLMVFYDMGYQCSKNTMRQVPSLIVGLIISMLGNYFLIQWCGLYGAIVSISVTYVYLLIYKMIDTHKYMQLSIRREAVVAMSVLVLDGALYYVLDGLTALAVCMIVSVLVMMVNCPQYIKQVVVSRLRKGHRS